MEFIPDKKTVEINENLLNLGNSLSTFIIEGADLPNVELIHVANIQQSTHEFNGQEFTNFKFIVSKDILHQIVYSNNLDSLIDYDEFNAPIYIIFGLLECIRMFYNSSNVYFVGRLPTSIYMTKN